VREEIINQFRLPYQLVAVEHNIAFEPGERRSGEGKAAKRGIEAAPQFVFQQCSSAAKDSFEFAFT